MQAAERLGIPLAVFAALFLLAAASRFVSVTLLTMHREPLLPRRNPAISLAGAFKSLIKGENGRLLLYLMAAQAAVQICSPYFTPFMLGELHFSYAVYAVVVCTAMVAKVCFLPMVGRMADRVGVRRVFWTSAVASIFGPLFWLVSNNWYYLVCVQVYSGMVWCTFDLATLLLYFETIPRQKRVHVLAFFNLANSAAMAGGSLLGAGISPRWALIAEAYLAHVRDFVAWQGNGDSALGPRPAGSVLHEVGRVAEMPHYLRRPLSRSTAPVGGVRHERDTTVGSRS